MNLTAVEPNIVSRELQWLFIKRLTVLLTYIYEMKEYLYNIYFNFCSVTRFVKIWLEKHWHIYNDAFPSRRNCHETLLIQNRLLGAR